jgi:hypothetical protein
MRGIQYAAAYIVEWWATQDELRLLDRPAKPGDDN